jgi:hypothetical protein
MIRNQQVPGYTGMLRVLLVKTFSQHHMQTQLQKLSAKNTQSVMNFQRKNVFYLKIQTFIVPGTLEDSSTNQLFNLGKIMMITLDL